MYESMMMRDEERSYEFERHGEPVLEVIAEAASIPEDAAKDVLEILGERHADLDAAQIGEECEFGSESHYEWKNARDHEYALEWKEIEHSLKSQSRFFNRSAEAFFLACLPISMAAKPAMDSQSWSSPGPGSEYKSFFRARVFHKSDDLDQALQRPDLHLGPPPGKFARAGRMNAHGISMFYGASDKGSP